MVSGQQPLQFQADDEGSRGRRPRGKIENLPSLTAEEGGNNLSGGRETPVARAESDSDQPHSLPPCSAGQPLKGC